MLTSMQINASEIEQMQVEIKEIVSNTKQASIEIETAYAAKQEEQPGLVELSPHDGHLNE